MTIDETVERGIAVFRLTGELDLKEAPTFESRLAARVTGAAPCAVVNLERLDYIDSAGLRTLLKTQSIYAAKGGKIALVAPSATVRHVLDITRTAARFQIYGTEAEAVTGLAGA